VKTYPNGATAMRALAAATGVRPIGCTQVTEILNTPGVALVAPLPPGCELRTTYTAAVAARAEHPDEARALIALLTGSEAGAARAEAGFV
jgi:molybdate transport system substrate-binding protein